ncbi:MAG: phospholipase D-like domain-containing protein [Candidatus Heimdallarchaeota archaeon]
MKINRFVIFVTAMLILPTVLMVLNPEVTVVVAKDPTNTFEPWVNPDAITTQTFTGVSKVTCFVGPDSAYEVIMKSLNDSVTSFYLEVYTLSSEPLVNRLIAAQDRGVDVQVSLSHDRVSGYEDDYTEEAVYRLDAAGVIVTWCSSSFTFTHAKFWIVDSLETFVYSGNWAPSSIPQVNYARTNRELGYAFEDASIATYYENVFFDDQAIGNPYAGTEPHLGALQGNETGGTYTHPFDVPKVINEYMEVTPIFAPDNSYALLSSLIDNATSTLDISQQYIKFDCLLFDDIIAAANRGVDVRVLIPEPGTSNENVTEVLLSNDIEIRFFKGLGHNHNKYVSADGEVTSISSINWSNNSVVNNREAGAIVKNANVAQYFKTVFDWDWANSEVPTGYTGVVEIIDVEEHEIIEGTYNIDAGFYIDTYTKGELFVGTTLAHTWTSPSAVVSHNLDTTAFVDGLYTIKVVGTEADLSTTEDEIDINIINNEEWLLLFSEVRFDADTPEPEGEFFELYNGFNFDVGIGGWEVSDNGASSVIPAGTVFAAGDILIFARNATAFAEQMTALGAYTDPADFTYGSITLANTGDFLRLDSPTTFVDAVVWGTGTIPTITAWTGDMDETLSLQRDPANHDTDDCSVDFITDTPNPGTVYITIPPTGTSGFIPGYVFVTSIFAIIVVATVSIKRRKQYK